MAAAAYKTAYADKPIDVAGSIVDSADKNVDYALKEEAKKETERKAKKTKNEALYGKSIANVIDTTDGPPSSQQISAQIGDQIAYLVQDSGLEGIELQNAINNTLKSGNSAISDTNTKYAEFQSAKDAPPNRYLNLNGEEDEAKEFNNGNRAIMFDKKTNRAYWVGDGVRTEVGASSKKAADTPNYGIKLDTTMKAITANYGTNPTTPRFQDNVANIEKDLLGSIGQQVTTYHQVGNAAAAIKDPKTGEVVYSDDDLRKLNEVGARIEADADNVSTEDKNFYNEMRNEVIQFKTNQVGSSIYGASAWDSRNAIKPKSTTIKEPKVPSETKDYIKAVITTLDEGPSIEEADELIAQVSESDETNNFADWKEAGYDVKVDYDDRDEGSEGHGKGTLNINGEDVRFESFKEMKELLKGVVLGDRQETLEKFNNVENIVVGDNYSQISTDLGISYRGQNIEFDPIAGGVNIKVGSKALKVPLEGLSPERRKQRIATIIENIKQ